MIYVNKLGTKWFEVVKNNDILASYKTDKYLHHVQIKGSHAEALEIHDLETIVKLINGASLTARIKLINDLLVANRMPRIYDVSPVNVFLEKSDPNLRIDTTVKTKPNYKLIIPIGPNELNIIFDTLKHSITSNIFKYWLVSPYHFDKTNANDMTFVWLCVPLETTTEYEDNDDYISNNDLPVLTWDQILQAVFYGNEYDIYGLDHNCERTKMEDIAYLPDKDIAEYMLKQYQMIPFYK